ncbi:MAG: ABC transporter ATP-binding protein [Lachnospiraceae bacterium]|nr:ABC transporter ATP-binding protein [Lachnospiraceae bacterium]
MDIVKINHLAKSYGKSRGIVDVSFGIGQGEFFGFIGPNGAGKSTTIRILLGLISADSGEAFVLGKPLSKASEYLADIGYLPSEANFYNAMKVDELIKYSAKLRGKECDKEAKELCDRLELDTKKKISELSLGNRKKVGIVCAMQHKPQLYIMDEPTSGLDPLMQNEFFSLLNERRKEGATVFFSSHVLSEVQQNCTRAAIIREGNIVAVDSIENLSKTRAKRVILHGINSLPDAIQAKSVEATNTSVAFLYQGDIKNLILEIGRLPITDMTITEPKLEEIFMHYYE